MQLAEWSPWLPSCLRNSQWRRRPLVALFHLECAERAPARPRLGLAADVVGAGTCVAVRSCRAFST